MNRHERFFQKSQIAILFLGLGFPLVMGIAWILGAAVKNRGLLESVRDVSVVLLCVSYLAMILMNQVAYFRWTGKFPFYQKFPNAVERVQQLSRENGRESARADS